MSSWIVLVSCSFCLCRCTRSCQWLSCLYSQCLVSEPISLQHIANHLAACQEVPPQQTCFIGWLPPTPTHKAGPSWSVPSCGRRQYDHRQAIARRAQRWFNCCLPSRTIWSDQRAHLGWAIWTCSWTEEGWSCLAIEVLFRIYPGKRTVCEDRLVLCVLPLVLNLKL